MDKGRGKTNWYVVTGGPGSGKTTTVNLLGQRGFVTTIENARHYLDMQRLDGKTVEEVRKNQREFQLRVLEMQIEQENKLLPGQVVFLDRAIPDAMAYYHFMNLPPDPKLLEAMQTASYKKVFILACLPMVNDYARREDGEAQLKIHAAIIDVYESMPFPVLHVPVLPAPERVEFILENM